MSGAAVIGVTKSTGLGCRGLVAVVNLGLYFALDIGQYLSDC
jgi:hypothetical protein